MNMLEKIEKSTTIGNNIISGINGVVSFIGVTVMGLIATVTGFITKNIIVFHIIAILAVVLAVVFLVLKFAYSNKNKVKGTFAVSAFIFTEKDTKLLLFRDDNKNQDKDGNAFYVQPSITYKKRFQKRKGENLQTPYEVIFSYLTDKLYFEHLKPISNVPLKYEWREGKQKISTFLTDNEEKLYDNAKKKQTVEENMFNYRDNCISLSPLLSTVENNPDTLKDSKEPLHIDFYYAFQLMQINKDINKGLQSGKYKLVSRGELEELIVKQQVHGDLLAIYDILLYTVNKIKPRPQISINNCTFTCRRKTAYWRITEKCNCNCQYCFLDNRKTEDRSNVSEEVINKVIEIIEKQEVEKLVISGGEPLLVENLLYVVQRISNANVPNLKISICTNGLIEFTDFGKLAKEEKFEKFVVSVDAHNREIYGRYKKDIRNKSADYGKLLNFIRNAKKNNIRIAANVILSYSLKKYFNDYVKFINDERIEELSISILIGNNDNNKNLKMYIKKMSEILDFYNMILNEKVKEFDHLEKLDFIMPSCVFSNGECECIENKKLIYISQEGTMTIGCAERMAMHKEVRA